VVEGRATRDDSRDHAHAAAAEQLLHLVAANMGQVGVRRSVWLDTFCVGPTHGSEFGTTRLPPPEGRAILATERGKRPCSSARAGPDIAKPWVPPWSGRQILAPSNGSRPATQRLRKKVRRCAACARSAPDSLGPDEKGLAPHRRKPLCCKVPETGLEPALPVKATRPST
jgi:hypothetical protein